MTTPSRRASRRHRDRAASSSRADAAIAGGPGRMALPRSPLRPEPDVTRRTRAEAAMTLVLTPPTRQVPPPPWRRRRLMVAVLLVAAVVALAAIALVSRHGDASGTGNTRGS